MKIKQVLSTLAKSIKTNARDILELRLAVNEAAINAAMGMKRIVKEEIDEWVQWDGFGDQARESVFSSCRFDERVMKSLDEEEYALVNLLKNSDRFSEAVNTMVGFHGVDLPCHEDFDELSTQASDNFNGVEELTGQVEKLQDTIIALKKEMHKRTESLQKSNRDISWTVSSLMDDIKALKAAEPKKSDLQERFERMEQAYNKVRNDLHDYVTNGGSTLDAVYYGETLRECDVLAFNNDQDLEVDQLPFYVKPLWSRLDDHAGHPLKVNDYNQLVCVRCKCEQLDDYDNIGGLVITDNAPEAMSSYKEHTLIAEWDEADDPSENKIVVKKALGDVIWTQPEE